MKQIIEYLPIIIFSITYFYTRDIFFATLILLIGLFIQLCFEYILVKKVSKKKADKYFSTRSRKSQIGAWASNQSSVLKDRKTLLKRFKIIQKRFENKDIPRPIFWSGYEIKPFLIEFWQGRENRLHDRIIYKKINQKRWKKYRLNP